MNQAIDFLKNAGYLAGCTGVAIAVATYLHQECPRNKDLCFPLNPVTRLQAIEEQK